MGLPEIFWLPSINDLPSGTPNLHRVNAKNGRGWVAGQLQCCIRLFWRDIHFGFFSTAGVNWSQCTSSQSTISADAKAIKAGFDPGLPVQRLAWRQHLQRVSEIIAQAPKKYVFVSIS